ncbi:tellurite resistance/C4-dicarboxylate transporter family protein [Mycobacterium sp. 1274756.6]|uniref:tellurite resistance/C4-dicarboxylate transporter family protein n=1 Tax=Mycobacterium sp. 1274756.6 TaxID=1834076 RepID=UPI00080219E0|nr:tellurite resistance/C4-dicarboxylate transporter family protein [Mycobacterium sp. 1274756.6]OBJ70250.1 C4-dicarboxylate ABC transporter [Mycobacterium sp. 1274756.6]
MTAALRTVTPSPDVFAAVMATGVLSIAAGKHGYRLLSEALGVLASVGLAVLVLLVAAVMVRRRRVAIWDFSDPDVALGLFTFVAACAVLDSRLEHHRIWVQVLSLVALVSWLGLSVLTVRDMAAKRWAQLRDRAHGAWLLGSVGTSGLAIVIAQMVRSTGQSRWLAVAVPVWLAALAVYLLMVWLLLWRAGHERTVRDGFEPDTWILMGGLAIATLAGDHLGALVPDNLTGVVHAVTLATWVGATLWIPPLIYFMLHRIHLRPGMLQFHGVWWALVFPLGMYAVASFATAEQLGRPALQTVSLVFFWDALAVWVIVVVAGLRRVFTRGGRPAPAG